MIEGSNAFTAFQDLTEDIQREIVRALLNVQIRRVDPNEPDPALEGETAEAAEPIPAPTPGAADATAPASPRADRPGGATDGAHVPRRGRLRRSQAVRWRVQRPHASLRRW